MVMLVAIVNSEFRRMVCPLRLALKVIVPPEQTSAIAWRRVHAPLSALLVTMTGFRQVIVTDAGEPYTTETFPAASLAQG